LFLQEGSFRWPTRRM